MLKQIKIAMEKEVLKLKYKHSVKLTRNEQRRGQKEFKMFESKVDPFIEEFESLLFNDDVFDDYGDLYKSYLERITQLCRYLNQYTFKVIEVDNYFFSETYKPLEVA